MACSVQITALVAERDAHQQRVEGLEQQQSFNDGLDDGIIRRLRTQAERLHTLVEEAVNGWKGALPHGDDVSTLVKQDRLTCRDLLQKADALFMSGGGKVRDGIEAKGVVPVNHVCGGGVYCPVCQAALRGGGTGNGL